VEPNEALEISDEEENNEVEYITLGHLSSGIIEEHMDKDADHIGSDWHTKSKKKCSPK
jgi:hypothetical protein